MRVSQSYELGNHTEDFYNFTSVWGCYISLYQWLSKPVSEKLLVNQYGHIIDTEKSANIWLNSLMPT